MKEKVIEITYRYLILNAAFLPVIILLRIAEYCYLSHTTLMQEQPFVIEAGGLLYDFRDFLVLILLMFVPFLLISLLNRRVANMVYILFLGLLILLQFSLIRYFAVNLVPLDDVFFRYSFSEVRMIISNSDPLNFMTFLPLILILLLFTGLEILAARVRLKPRVITLLSLCYLAALFLSIVRPPSMEAFASDTVFYFEVNKSSYFIREGISSLFLDETASEADEIADEIDRYHELHPEFDFTSKNYPLVHINNTNDVLGPSFNLQEQPPNLVFIIVESLSAACIGDQSWYGNFTPFLDSLKNKGLYWDNFLSSSERTFHVFASIFGSLPFGNGEFLKDLSKIPFHYSLIRYLRENGYYTSVYYGGDLSFTNYKEFFLKERTDFMLDYFGPEYQEKQKLYPEFTWGYHDEFTFARSLEVIDSLNREPRLDIYLTLSTHNPFQPPNAGYYMKRYEEITNQPGYPKEKKERTDLDPKIFASILYTDDALRKFFNEYSKRDDFKNTIFFITGDHFFMELGYSTISAIERYHVPMFIYSPLIKSPAHFSSVSSHQDVTPSVTAMLQKKYHFNDHPFVHWLGQGIDTTASFRNVHTMQFVSAGWDLVDFLKGGYFLSKNRLYKLKPGLQTEPVEDDRKLKELTGDLKATTAVAQYATKNDRIILHELFRMVKFDTTDVFDFDTSGVRFDDPPGLFINLVPPLQFDSSYWKIIYNLDFKYFIRESNPGLKLPRLILTIEDSTYKSNLYHQIVFPDAGMADTTPGIWHRYQGSDELNLNSIMSLQDNRLKIYFFNTEGCNIIYDSLKFSLKGIY